MRLIEILCDIISDGVRDFGRDAVYWGLVMVMSWVLFKLGFREDKPQEEEHVKTVPPAQNRDTAAHSSVWVKCALRATESLRTSPKPSNGTVWLTVREMFRHKSS